MKSNAKPFSQKFLFERTVVSSKPSTVPDGPTIPTTFPSFPISPAA